MENVEHRTCNFELRTSNEGKVHGQRAIADGKWEMGGMENGKSRNGRANTFKYNRKFSRPFGTGVSALADPTLMRWAIVKCPSGTKHFDASAFPKRVRGFTFVDLLIVVVTVLALSTVVWLWVTRPRVRINRIQCINQLRQLGLGFRIWANDNNGSYPMTVPTNQGGTMEYNETGMVFRHYQALSNELNQPKILACVDDPKRIRATNWDVGFGNQNISYFVGLEGNETNAQSILSGDRNITGGGRLKNRIMLLRWSSKPAWMPILHTNFGNVGLGDGSAQKFTAEGLQKQLQAEFKSVTNEVIRLAVP